MDGLREFLNLGWVSSAIGLAGLVVALILYRASIIGARPVCQRRGIRLIGPDLKALPQEVEIRFRGQVVDRLTKTLLIVWNGGKALLRGVDIVADDPFRAEFSKDAQVLQVRVLKTTRVTNKFSARRDFEANRVLFEFDYLDPRDGAVVEILHTDEKRYPQLAGTIRGVPKGVVDLGRVPSQLTRDLPPPLNRRRLFYGLVLTVSLLAIAGAALLPDAALHWLFQNGRVENLARLRKAFWVVGLLYGAPPVLQILLTRRRFPKTLNVPELDE